MYSIREAEATEGCGQCPGGSRAYFHAESSEGLRGRAHLGEPNRAKLWEKLGEDSWPGNSKHKGIGAGKNQLETQTGTTMAGICPGRNYVTGIGRSCFCEALGHCQEVGFIFLIPGGS